MEAILLDMQTQRMRVSPRAIEHGWVEEMEKKIKDQRALITDTKLNVIFTLGYQFKVKEQEYWKLKNQIQKAEEKRQQVTTVKV